MTRAESTGPVPSGPPPRTAGAFTAATVFVVGVMISGFFLTWLQDRADHRTEATTSFVGLTLQARFAEVLRQIRAIEGLVLGSAPVEPAEFATFTASTGFVPGVEAWGIVEVDIATGLPISQLYEAADQAPADSDLYEIPGAIAAIQRARWTRSFASTPLGTDGQVWVFDPIVSPERTVKWMAMAAVDVDGFLHANTPDSMTGLLDIALTTANEPVPKGAASFDVRLGDIQWLLVVEMTETSGVGSPGVNVLLTAVSLALLSALAGWGATAAARRRAAQLELTEQRKLNQARDDFLAAVSHEVRTPLSAVLGFASVLLRDWKWLDDPTREEFLRTVTEHANDVGAIVQDLLVVGRADIDGLHLSVRDVPIADIVGHTVRRLPAEVADRIRDDTENVTVRGDRARLRQIIRNLLDNAVQHGGGSIAVNTEIETDHVRLCVSDDGPGIPSEDVQRIFDPYFQIGSTTRPLASMGLGLYVSRRLAEAMEGTLTYRRLDGVTIFELRLPSSLGTRDSAEPTRGTTHDEVERSTSATVAR